MSDVGAEVAMAILVEKVEAAEKRERAALAKLEVAEAIVADVARALGTTLLRPTT